MTLDEYLLALNFLWLMGLNDLHGFFKTKFRINCPPFVCFGCHNVPRSPPIVKIRAPHRDARRTLSTPTRRAPHFFPCARLCATFLGSSAPHRTLCPLLCFAPLSSRWTLLSKVRVAIRCSGLYEEGRTGHLGEPDFKTNIL